jgi:hypothetical protein
MTTIMGDIAAADRVLKRACQKVTRLIREGAHEADYLPVLIAAGVAADVLLEEPA